MLKKFYLCLVSFIFLFSTFCFAEGWNSVSQVTTIQENGDVVVYEIIEATADSGTEWYKEFKNSDNVVVDKVVDKDTGEELQKINWNLDASLSQKAGKWGINNTKDGFELCWGKSKIGVKKTFILTYTYKGLLKLTTDNVAIFNHSFFEAKGDNLKYQLIIPELVDETSNVWLFGSDKIIDFTDRGIEINDGNISGNEEIIVMLEVEDDELIDKNLLTKINKTSDEIKNEAFKESDYKANESKSLLNIANFFKKYWKVFAIILNLITIIALYFHRNIALFFPLLFFSNAFITTTMLDLQQGITVNNVYKSGIDAIPHNFGIIFVGSIIVLLVNIISGIIGYKMLKLKKYIDNLPYYRDCPKDLIKASGVVYNFAGVLKTKNANLIGAMIMDLTEKGNLEVVRTEEVGLFGKVSTKESFAFKKCPEDPYYKKLYEMLRAAAGSNHLLDEKEITNYAKVHFEEINSFIKSCTKASTTYFINNKFNALNLNNYSEEKLKELNEIFGLRNYIKDFTLLNEREVYEITNWGELLVYATLLGQADKVMERMKIVLPDEFKENGRYYYYGRNYGFINRFGTTMHITSARSYSQAHRSSGSGGRGSFGGGGGHSGGGGHGGR